MLPRSFQVAELVPVTSLAKVSTLVSSGRVGPATSQLTTGEILPHRRDHSALTSVITMLPRSFQVAELVPMTSLAKASTLVSSGRVGPATSQLTTGEILPHRRDHSALTSVNTMLPRSF